MQASDLEAVVGSSAWRGLAHLEDLVLGGRSFGSAERHGVVGDVVFRQQGAGGRVGDAGFLGRLAGDLTGLAQFDHLLQLAVRNLQEQRHMSETGTGQLQNQEISYTSNLHFKHTHDPSHSLTPCYATKNNFM